MKYTKLITLALSLFVALTVSAQLKIGHINSQELLASMPESDSAQKQIETIAKQHEAQFEEMSVEFNKKYEDFMQTYNDMTELARATKQAELEDMQKRIETYRQMAEQEIQQKRMQFFQPIQEKAVKAVNEVAAENSFTYILDTGMGVVVYTAPDSEDIMPLVKKKLGME